MPVVREGLGTDGKDRGYIGNVAGNRAWEAGLEAPWSAGPWSVFVEYARSDLSTDSVRRVQWAF